LKRSAMNALRHWRTGEQTHAKTGIVRYVCACGWHGFSASEI
jgi:hypothetical protein